MVIFDDRTAQAWLKQEGFADGDLRSEITENEGSFDEKTMCPMACSSQKGELGMCKWLHENGAAADITRANNFGVTPMWPARMAI